MRFISLFFLVTMLTTCANDSIGQSRKYKQAMKELNETNELIKMNAADRQVAVAKIIDDTKKKFKPQTYEYFRSFNRAGTIMAINNHVQALKYLEEARTVFKIYHQKYKDSYEKDLGAEFLEVLSSMQGIHMSIMGMDDQSTFLQTLESEQQFVNTLSSKTQIDYQLMLAKASMWANKLERAERALDKVRTLLDTSPRLISESESQSIEMEYKIEKGSLLRKKGNVTGSDSLFQSVRDQSEKLRSNYIQSKPDKTTDRAYILHESFYGYSLDSMMKVIQSPQYYERYSNKTPLPRSEPKGYFESIRYYIRKNEVESAQKLLREARMRLKEYEQNSIQALLDSQYYRQLNELEAILDFSQRKYEKIIAMRGEPLKNLDATLAEALPYLSDKELQSYYNRYQFNLNQYLSVLSSSGDSTHVIKLFEKSVATRGLLLSVSKERGRIAQLDVGNKAAKEIAWLNKYRERANFYAQKVQVTPNETDLDSLRYFENKVSQLQRDINNQLGISIHSEKPVSWKQIQNKLIPGECFVFVQQFNREYFDSAYYNPLRFNPEYWFIYFDKNSNAPLLIKIGDAADLDRGLRFYHNAINSTLEDRVSYSLFWKPIANLIEGSKKVYFSADGLYHLINPYTMFNTTTQKYVLDEIEIVRLSQPAMVVKRTTSLDDSKSQFVFIGNPDFSMNRRTETSIKIARLQADFTATDNLTRSGLVQLPGAEHEVVEISQQASKLGHDVILLTGTEATEVNVKRFESPEVLHFATHGVFESNSTYDAFLRSKLVLAGVNDGNTFTPDDHSKFEDGWLTAFEVAQLNLKKTKLVVLSACQTAVGDLKASDGVYGLQRAFEVAGAKYVLGSLWPINDQATATFMNEFYTSYFVSGDTQRSYHTAMVATRKKYAHPNYWGSFILNGSE